MNFKRGPLRNLKRRSWDEISEKLHLVSKKFSEELPDFFLFEESLCDSSSNYRLISARNFCRDTSADFYKDLFRDSSRDVSKKSSRNSLRDFLLGFLQKFELRSFKHLQIVFQQLLLFGVVQEFLEDFQQKKLEGFPPRMAGEIPAVFKKQFQ